MKLTKLFQDGIGSRFEDEPEEEEPEITELEEEVPQEQTDIVARAFGIDIRFEN